MKMGRTFECGPFVLKKEGVNNEGSQRSVDNIGGERFEIHLVDLLLGDGFRIPLQAVVLLSFPEEVRPLVDFGTGDLDVQVALDDLLEEVAHILCVFEAAHRHDLLRKGLVLESAHIFAQRDGAAQTVIDVVILAKRIPETMRKRRARLHHRTACNGSTEKHLVVVLIRESSV